LSSQETNRLLLADKNCSAYSFGGIVEIGLGANASLIT
jgi:hypothetical protein